MEKREGQQIRSISERLLLWFSQNARPLPWRRQYTPYQVWISEIMLQQTQMERGVAYYRRWMELFPDIQSLADASEESVLRAWEGLGYYSRARNILRCARILVEKNQGHFPEELEDIRKLPGIGSYTAAAIASIAFGQHVACVDANVERVVSRLFNIDEDVRSKSGREKIETLAHSLIPCGMARMTNQACMEFGALVCRKEPCCKQCPLAEFCRARAAGLERERPVKNTSTLRRERHVVAVLFFVQNRLLVRKRGEGGLWPNLTTLPYAIVQKEMDMEGLARELIKANFASDPRSLSWSTSLKHVHTAWKVSLEAFAFTCAGQMHLPDSSFRLLPVAELSRIPFPAPHRRILERYFAERGEKA